MQRNVNISLRIEWAAEVGAEAQVKVEATAEMQNQNNGVRPVAPVESSSSTSKAQVDG
jgi:hypothetical protein